MPSRAYTSFLQYSDIANELGLAIKCQCPLGLIPHFYGEYDEQLRQFSDVSMPSRAYTSFLQGKMMILSAPIGSVNALSSLYLISTDYCIEEGERGLRCVNALSGLYLISTFTTTMDFR